MSLFSCQVGNVLLISTVGGDTEACFNLENRIVSWIKLIISHSNGKTLNS